MNEDNDFNESLETEPAVEAKKGAPESDGLSGSTNDTEAIGEEILNAAANQAKMSKGGRQKDKAKIAELEAKIAELTSDLQRTRADFENFRRQADLQREQYGKTMEENPYVFEDSHLTTEDAQGVSVIYLLEDGRLAIEMTVAAMDGVKIGMLCDRVKAAE